MEELIDLVNAWVKSDVEHLDAQWQELLKALYTEEKEYLVKYYQPKGCQFCLIKDLFWQSPEQIKMSRPVLIQFLMVYSS
jgi:hypothetical protein